MSDAHPLTPLLNPRSVALVGASARAGTVGNGIVQALVTTDFPGTVYPVNPKYDEIEGFRCYPSLSELPGPVDLALLCVAGRHLEALMIEAIEQGARSATVFDACYLEQDADAPLVERLGRLAREAGIPVCGGNCMGFYNLDARAYICGYPRAAHFARGGIAFITHSGTNFGSLPQGDNRLGFNMVISSGQEMVTTMADYMDYALEQSSTRVLALFLETVRDPEAFVAALEKARARDIPVVALKIGRTAESARMAETHSGAIAGNDAAYQAVFDHHGVIRVEHLYEMAATLSLIGHPRRMGPGGLAVIGDSGGERGMMVDLAEEIGVPFAEISAETSARLAAKLAPGLAPENPTDAWGTLSDYQEVFRAGLTALLDDPDTAIGVLLRDLRTGDGLSETLADVAIDVAATRAKPVAIATNYSGSAHRELALRVSRAGVPVLDGTREMLMAVKHAMVHRDFHARPRTAPRAPAPDGVGDRWRAWLSNGTAFTEVDGLALLGDYGIPVPTVRVVETAAEAAAAAAAIGLPVVLKTAMPRISHKTDVGGIHLNLADRAAVTAAYDDLARRLGPGVLVAPMIGNGVEMALGMMRDPQFGPLVMIGAGGALIEVLDDRRFVVPPIDPGTARRIIDSLRIRPLLDGKRGRPPADVDALANAVSRFSELVVDLGAALLEMDVNPFVALPDGCLALDALVVGGMSPVQASGTEDVAAQVAPPRC